MTQQPTPSDARCGEPRCEESPQSDYHNIHSAFYDHEFAPARTGAGERAAYPQCQKCGLVIAVGQRVFPSGANGLEHHPKCPRCVMPHSTEADVECGLNANFHTNAGHPFRAAPAATPEPGELKAKLAEVELLIVNYGDDVDRLASLVALPVFYLATLAWEHRDAR